jgi:succinate dehydrogenase / fumarate reductase iron-sulfur subunit
VKINGQSTLACLTQIGEAHEFANRAAKASGSPSAPQSAQTPETTSDGPIPITVEPMGNMPVIKDLATDMETTHWEKFRRVTPWLLPTGPPPEREYIVPAEAMVDVTQSVACIQCGACVSSCLSMEADPDFVGPAALAKAYRFVGDPRDGQTTERLYDLANDPHGMYDCTHCFSCIDACPKGVAPMNQIMRLRRLAGDAHEIDDVNNGHRHEAAFVKLIEKKGTLDESALLQESFAPGIKGKLMPRVASIKGLFESIPTAIRGIRTGKMRSIPKLIPGVHHKLPGDSQDHVKRIYERAEDSRIQLNLYVIGEGGEEDTSAEAVEPESVSEENAPA